MNNKRKAPQSYSIARRIANQQWGEVNGYHTVAPGIWEFSCSSHGGVVLDLNQYPEEAEKFRKFKCFVYKSKKENKGLLSEQHFAVFEEDCDIAVVSYALFDLFAKSNYKSLGHNGTKGDLTSYTEFREKYRERVVKTLLEYHKEWAKEWYSKEFFNEVRNEEGVIKFTKDAVEKMFLDLGFQKIEDSDFAMTYQKSVGLNYDYVVFWKATKKITMKISEPCDIAVIHAIECQWDKLEWPGRAMITIEEGEIK